MRVVFAALVLGLATAAHPTTHRAAGLAVDVRAVIVSGTPQTVYAHASTSSAKYVSDFPKHLVVRVIGGKGKAAKRRVAFVCETPRCALWAPDLPEGGDRDGPGDYEIYAKDGMASLHVSITADSPAGTYVVVAKPEAKNGERSIASARFTLTSR